MWFSLLSVAAFVAVGSCRGFYSYYDNEESSVRKSPSPEVIRCTGPGCPCVCKNHSCPPCPLPIPIKCLNACGTPECPCLNFKNVKSSGEERAAEKLQHIKPKNIANALSTVIDFPTGPICSAFNVQPHMVVTLSSCIIGRNVKDLYVTLNDMSPTIYGAETLKVVHINVFPQPTGHADPVILILEKPKIKVDYLAIPNNTFSEDIISEMHKWKVLKGGQEYTPIRTELVSTELCEGASDTLCASTYTPTEMGWNDIGTPVVQVTSPRLTAIGIYAGYQLYQHVDTVRYLSLFQYAEWINRAIKFYP